MIYLYIKTHLNTGLKYFGYTKNEDPYSYLGSGTYWKRHLLKHGNDISTYILAEFDDDCKEEAKTLAEEFSIINDIVNYNDWANLKLETLDGGWDHINNENKEKFIAKTAITVSNWSEEYRKSVNNRKRNCGDKNGMYGVSRSKENNPRWGSIVKGTETAKKISVANKGKKRSQTVKEKQSRLLKERWKNGCFDNRPPMSEEAKRKLSERVSQTKWYNNGNISVRKSYHPGDGWILGRLPRTNK